MLNKLLVVFFSTFLISNVSNARYAHVRTHDSETAILIFDALEEQNISSLFPGCVTRIWKNNLDSHINYFNFKIQNYQLNILYQLFHDSEKIGMAYCLHDKELNYQLQAYHNYSQDNVFLLLYQSKYSTFEFSR